MILEGGEEKGFVRILNRIYRRVAKYKQPATEMQILFECR